MAKNYRNVARDPVPKKVLLYLPVIVLFVIALNQLRLAYYEDLTPWKGGGFGMFSTVDARGARKFTLYADVKNGPKKIKIEVDPSIKHHFSYLRSMPYSENTYSKIKKGVLNFELYYLAPKAPENDSPYIEMMPRGSVDDLESESYTIRLIEIETLYLEFKKYFFNSENNQMTSKTLWTKEI